MKKLIFIFAILISFTAKADVLTHAIGDTGYMIREAMQAKANKLDRQNYFEALKNQKIAKTYLLGTAKSGRNTKKALELTQKAYLQAKLARDNALKISKNRAKASSL